MEVVNLVGALGVVGVVGGGSDGSGRSGGCGGSGMDGEGEGGNSLLSWSVFVCLLASGSLWATCSPEAYCMYILLLYCFAMTLYHIYVLLVSSLIMFVFPVVCRCGYPYLY